MPNTATATFTAPDVDVAGETLTFNWKLPITIGNRASDTVDVTVNDMTAPMRMPVTIRMSVKAMR